MMALRSRGVRPHRAAAGWLTALALATGACAADGADTALDTAAAVEASDTTGTAAVDTTGSVADESASPTPVEDAGEVTPVVVCVDQRGAAFFGYTSTASAPVTIAVGDANRVTGADGTAATDQQPDVFAPGDRGIVFWTDTSLSSEPATWTLTGADGTERAATADDSAPPCPTGPTLDPPDDRVARVVGTVDDDGDAATITITVEGIPDESRCPAGPGTWRPERPDVFVETFGRNVTRQDGADRSRARLTVDDPTQAPVTGFDVEGFASIDVWVDVDDRCTDESGMTSRAWGASESLRDLSQIGTKICFGATTDGYAEVECTEGPILVTTGGLRSR